MQKSLLVISTHNIKRIVRIRDILYFERVDNKIILHTFNEELRVGSTLRNIEKKLSESDFYRTHRSYLINLHHVKEVEMIGDRVWQIHFTRGGKVAYMSRERYQNFIERLSEGAIII